MAHFAWFDGIPSVPKSADEDKFWGKFANSAYEINEHFGHLANRKPSSRPIVLQWRGGYPFQEDKKHEFRSQQAWSQ